MMRTWTVLAAALVAAAAPAQTPATRPAGAAYALVHGRVFPVTAPPIDDGVVVMRGGKIVAVGAFGETPVPADAIVVDVSGHVVVPGFIELHNHTGVSLSELNDTVYQVNPEFRVVDHVQFRTKPMEVALAGGVTTLLTIPGSGSNMGGFGVVMKTWGASPEDVVVRFPGALKIAQAGNPERGAGEVGAGRMGMNWLIRNVLLEAREYHRAMERFERGEAKEPPQRNLRYEPLRGLFKKEYPIAVHTQWFQVVQSTIRILKKELDLDPFVDHGEWEGYLNTPELVKHGVPAALGPREFDYDAKQAKFLGIAASYYWSGLGGDDIGVNTDAPVVPQEELPYQVAMAVRLGLPEDVALKTITINAARMLKLEKRLGSLEVGKDADVAVWTGDPFDPRRRTQMVFVDGEPAYDAARDGLRF
ncbi:MAG TPA: amidohydrolase family protein [Planctomycetota bacterium]|nr:amidohydrolase family protein [Planctomycetota bacterium]